MSSAALRKHRSRSGLTGGLLLLGAALTGCPGQSAPPGALVPPPPSSPAATAQAPSTGEVSGPAPVEPPRASVASPLREDDKTAVSVDATIQNLEGGRARYEVKGRVGYLPDGAVLTVSFRVRDLLPVIEAAFFQVEIKDGTFEGFRDWSKGTFAPIGYQTVVTLSMQTQNPLVRKFLGKELGYTSETTVTIGTDDDDLGTPEERSAFAIETLKQLSRFTARTRELHAELVPKLDAPAGAEWPAYVGTYEQSLKGVLTEVRAMKGRFILWYEGHRISKLEQSLRILSRAVRTHGEGQDAKGDATMVLNDLIQLKAEIDARLPMQPGETPAPTPQTEKR